MIAFFNFQNVLYFLVEVFIKYSIQSVVVMNLKKDERFLSV